MNKYRFNPENNMFYPYSMKESYEASGDWPVAGADVSEDIYLKFIGEAPDGKKLGSDKKGNPVWVDIPPLMREQHVAIAESRKLALIAEVHTETEMLRAKLALGRISDDEKVLLNAWLDYLDKLKGPCTRFCVNAFSQK